MHAVSLPRWAVIKDARRRQRRRHRRQAILLAMLAAVGVGLLTQRSDAGLQSAGLASAARLDSIGIGGYIGEAQATGPRIWVLTCVQLCGAADTGLDQEQLVEVDAGTNVVTRRLPLADASAFAAVGPNLWIAHFISGQITRINLANGRITARLNLRLPAPIAPGVHQFLPISLSASDAYLWASTARGWIAQIDRQTGKLVRMIRTPSEDNASTTDRYGTWVAENLDGVGLLAPGSTHLRVRAIMQAGLPLDVDNVLNGGGIVWAVASTNQWGTPTRTVVLEMNARTDRVIRRVQLPDTRGAVVTNGGLYLGALNKGHIYRVDRGGRLERFDTPRRDATLATADAHILWGTTNARPGHLLRIKLPG
jgi:hypothetical protein